jgi:sec-independent protein translocase protein TatA
MLQNIGIPGLLLILGIFILVFGPKRIPEIAESIGKALKKFKESQKEDPTIGSDKEKKDS